MDGRLSQCHCGKLCQCFRVDGGCLETKSLRFFTVSLSMANVPGKFMITSRPFWAPYHSIQALSTESILISHIVNHVSLPHLDLIIFTLYLFISWP
jgi:hypothetical protein